MSQRPTFQELLARLQRYWADQGCIVWMPSNVEVGAGTMNPATFLQVLGPEPWNVVYLEPSLRPDDARYGENPNRLGRHHQLQVILKPDPGDPQQLYLDSLAAAGIDLARHDIRFVEDNWTSPALGAWGLGWEVWLDGLEITQYTYFQQAGSIELEPVSVEITYGLDRILMALQDVAHFRDLAWSEAMTFGELFLDYEIQTSRYYFELADVSRLGTQFELCEAEARLALDHGLSRVAHDYVLKCSHLFNVLDARGTIGVTERARYFQRMRDLARAVAQAYVAEREGAGWPRAGAMWPIGAPITAPLEAPGAPPSDDADFVLEVGTEELPAADVALAMDALRARMPELLTELRLGHGAIRIGATPRRLVVHVLGLAALQEDVAEEVVGPPTKAAYDAGGRPTAAATGFARKMGVSVDDLAVVERAGEARVAAVRREAGRPASAVLGEPLARMVGGIAFARTMRWNASRATFSRPVRWLVALHGEAIVPMTFAGAIAGRTTRGARPAGSPTRRLAAACDYPKLMRALGIAIDPEARSAEIARQVAEAARALGGHAHPDQGLLAEVTNLVEQPRAIGGSFDPAFLELPEDLLVTVMRKHQRYFPVHAGPDATAKLLPAFVALVNGAGLDAEAVQHGNEAVLRARLADAAYFWKRDRRQPLEAFSAHLDGLTFQADLGSMADKVRRLERLVPRLAARLGIEGVDLAHAVRAASLAKSDLATAMVVDFTSLQGVMGSEYALLSGESAATALAIREQYLPKAGDDALPTSPAGMVLALADRLDSLVGLFAVGLKPTGAQDPFALRRTALGITRIVAERRLGLDLADALADAAAELPVAAGEAVLAEALAFLRTRLEGQLREAGYPADAVAAVLAVRAARPAAAHDAVAALTKRRALPGWPQTLDAYARCARLVRSQVPALDAPPPEAPVHPAERALRAAIEGASAELDLDEAQAVLTALDALSPAIVAFFDAVLVMSDDAGERARRLALLSAIAQLPRNVADLSLLEGF